MQTVVLDTVRLWQQTLREIELQMSREDFRTWFRNTEISSLQGPRCIVGIENPLTKGWLDTKCRGLVARTMEGITGQPMQIEFAVRPQPVPVGPAPALELEPTHPRARSKKSSLTESASASRMRVSARYTFNNFVVGSGNQLAHAACVAAAQQAGRSHNPLFIYGGVGLGKTHLLHAIGHHALEADLEVVYVSSETFTNEFIEAVSRGRMEAFRARYRRADILLIDDVQFIAGKEQTQEEFFHTFNEVYDGAGQIVLTSDRPPRAIATLAQRLQSRFSMGLIADIQEPNLETRIAILQAKLAERPAACTVPPEVLAFIAERVPSNVRELEGALNRVLAQAEMLGTELTPELARLALDPALPALALRVVDPDTVIKAVCRMSGIGRRALEGPGRDRKTTAARQVAMYLLREQTDLSLAEIGGLLGGRDHTTILHGHGKITRSLADDESLQQTVAALRSELAQRG